MSCISSLSSVSIVLKKKVNFECYTVTEAKRQEVPTKPTKLRMGLVCQDGRVKIKELSVLHPESWQGGVDLSRREFPGQYSRIVTNGNR